MYLLVGFVFLLLFAMVIINGFYCQQVNWHIVDAGHFFLENKVVAKSFNTIETLQFRLLGNEEGNTSFFQAGDIPFEKVITYQVEVFLSVTLQIFAHDVDFGVKSNSVLHCRVGAEEFIQHLIVFVVAFGMQVELQYSTRRLIFFFLLPESDFSVLLLVRTDNSFMYFTENDDFFFISGEQHQHPCSKISALT